MVEIKACAMCKQDFPAAELDFLDRCVECFRKYLALPEGEKPNLGVPGTKGYNSTWGVW